MHAQRSPQFYAVLSILAALLTIILKSGAFLVTGSVGLFSDAAESLVNLLAAFIALWALTLAARPPDDEHMYGHSKAEYFASGLEGALILLAAVSIGWTAWQRLQAPQPLERIGIGLTVSAVAAVINGGIAVVLLRAGRELRSITLQADAQHLLTDVWTTFGVVVGIILATATGQYWLDPVIGLVVAVNIVWTGIKLLRQTGYGLLDSALPPEDQRVIDTVLQEYEHQGIVFHALRTRQSGLRRFISFHVLVPGDWSVQRGHDLCESIELHIARVLPDSNVTTHLEPLEDPIAWDDQGLDRVVVRKQERG